MSVNVVTFGCRLNTYESQLIERYAKVAKVQNVVIFNSCAVTSEAERQLRQAIRKAKRSNPDAKIIVTGCAAQISPEKYASMQEVEHVIGNDEKLKQGTYASIGQGSDIEERVLVNDIMSVKETAHHLISGINDRARAFLQVQNGCNHRCTFCIIPYGRGNSRSVPVGEIVQNAKKLTEEGYKELILTGVDITDYGSNLPGNPTLGNMIARLLNLVPDLPRLRLSSIDVAEIDDELFHLIATEKRFMPHLHLSLQAGDNMILKRMKRRHNREQVIEFCKKIKKARPEIVFGADIIAGFPTETDEMFKNTLNIIEDAGLTYLHIFPYSPRPGTPAARMPQVKREIIKERAKALRKRGAEMLKKHLDSQVEKILNVLLEKENFGHAEDHTPVKLTEAKCKDDVGKILQYRVISSDNSFVNAVKA